MRNFLIIVSILMLACGTACGAKAASADALPASGYFPIMPIDAPDNTALQLIPVASNHPLDGVHRGITRAVIVIHDETRDANAAMASLAVLLGGSNTAVMLLAPQFLLPSDLARVAYHLPEQGRLFATWQYNDWPMGGDSIAAPPQKGISSFTAIDLLLMYLVDHAAYPDLQTIVVAGYGAGANFVQRYAAFNAAASVVDRQNINLHYVVAGATSYLYVTPYRPLGGRKGLGRPDVAACASYNDYPYGLDKLVPYARHVGVNAAKTDYSTRFIAYLNAPGSDAFPESQCAALVQGGNGGARTENFHAYLNSLYGDMTARTQIFNEPKDVRNDAIGLFGSTCGMAVLFGDWLCPAPAGGMMR